MAKIKSKSITSKFKTLKGMSTKDILNMDVYKLKTASLKQVTNRLVSSANKRLRRLYEKAPNSPSLRYHLDDNGKLIQFSSKGLNHRNQYEILMKSLRNFLNSKTSTITGFKKSRNEVVQRLGEFEDTEQESTFWRMYDKWKRTHANEFNRANFQDTNELAQMFYDEFVVNGRSERGTSSKITRVIRKMLEDTATQKTMNDIAMENDLKNGNAIRFKDI